MLTGWRPRPSLFAPKPPSHGGAGDPRTRVPRVGRIQASRPVGDLPTPSPSANPVGRLEREWPPRATERRRNLDLGSAGAARPPPSAPAERPPPPPRRQWWRMWLVGRPLPQRRRRGRGDRQDGRAGRLRLRPAQLHRLRHPADPDRPGRGGRGRAALRVPDLRGHRPPAGHRRRSPTSRPSTPTRAAAAPTSSRATTSASCPPRSRPPPSSPTTSSPWPCPSPRGWPRSPPRSRASTRTAWPSRWPGDRDHGHQPARGARVGQPLRRPDLLLHRR